MQSKIQAAVRASDGGCAVTIASGLNPKETIIDIIKGRKVGTFITPDKDYITTDTAVVADEGLFVYGCTYQIYYTQHVL